MSDLTIYQEKILVLAHENKKSIAIEDFNYSFDMKNEADLIDKAVSQALEVGPRTADIMADGREKVGTKGMMDIVLRKLEELTN